MILLKIMICRNDSSEMSLPSSTSVFLNVEIDQQRMAHLSLPPGIDAGQREDFVEACCRLFVWL